MNQPKEEEKEKLIDTPLHGLYIPSFFILFGTAFFGLDKIIYGVIMVVFLVGFQFVDTTFFKKKSKLSDKKFKPFELIERTIISKDSAIYRFKLKDEEDSIKVPLGHHLACNFTSDELKEILDEKNDEKLAKTKEFVKYYTPISSKYDTGFFDILVKSYPEGLISKKLATMVVHQNVKFKGPVGRFNSEQFLTLDHCDNKEKKVTLIAGGSGITPFLRIIIESPMTMAFNLVYYSKTEKDILLKSEIDDVAEFKKNFNVKYMLGELTEENLTANVDTSLDKSSSVLICGPPNFKKKAEKCMNDLGFSETFVF